MGNASWTRWQDLADKAKATMPPADPSAPFTCEFCHGAGWRPDPKEPNAVIRCRECNYWANSEKHAPGVPVDERESFLNTFTVTDDNRDAVKHAVLFLSGVHPDLYLFGPVGTGKTRLACSLANESHKAGQRVLFLRTPELLVRLQPGSDTTDDAMKRATDVPVLVLDDVGANQASDFARRMLQVIYDGRIDQGHRTIWTSNLDLDQLTDHLSDARLPSRIVGRAKVLKMLGKDWRIKRARGRR